MSTINGTSSTALLASSKLGDLLASLPVSQSDQWNEIEVTAQSLANELRVRDVEQQTTLGRTLLPQTLTSLLKGAITSDGSSIPQAERKPSIYELLRVGANLCMDHNENRSHLDEAGLPQAVVSILETYAELTKPDVTDPLPLSIPDLRVVKTAIGVLLNLSVGYEPVKTRLVSLETAQTILKLSIAIYPPGSWSRPSGAKPNGTSPNAEGSTTEEWTLRTGLSQWAWRAISELRDNGQEAVHIFTPEALPYLVRILRAYIPPYAPIPAHHPPALIRTFLQSDFDALEEACGLLESLALDLEEVRLSLARGLSFPAEHGGVACLSELLDFVDRGDYPPYWSSDTSGEQALRYKGFDRCKGAVVKALVEVAGDEKNIDVLWDDSDAQKPGGELVDMMVQWIRQHKNLNESNRDDLLICATLTIGNLVRRDAHATAIVHPPISLASDLAALLEPETDIKVKHGVIGLLKHLTQSPGNRSILGKAHVIQRLSTSQVWDERADMVQIVQISAIGIAKHMCTSNAENAITLVLGDPDQSAPTPLSKLLALGDRSDYVAIKSEATRVIVHSIKSLWAADASNVDSRRRKEAMNALATLPCASALAQLLGRSKKYPTLVNEAVVALFLIATRNTGSVAVLDALLNPLPQEATSSQNSIPISAGPATESPAAGTPRRALDMIVTYLRNPDNKVPPEIRANICMLLRHLGTPNILPESRGHDVHVMKENTRELLELAAEDREGHVAQAAKKALHVYA